MAHSLRTKLPRAVLFDYDGVLVSSESIHLEAWMQLLEELGLPKELKLIQQYTGRTAPEIIKILLERYKDQIKPGSEPLKYDPHTLAQRKNLFFLSIAKDGLATYPGVIEGIRELRSRGVLTAVVSNARRFELEHTMRNLGLYELMDQVVARDDVSAFKPDPIPYLFAAAALSVPVEDCIAVEDSPPGLEAALMGRIPAAAVTTNFSKEILEFPVPGRRDLKPVWIGPSMIEFFKWVLG